MNRTDLRERNRVPSSDWLLPLWFAVALLGSGCIRTPRLDQATARAAARTEAPFPVQALRVVDYSHLVDIDYDPEPGDLTTWPAAVVLRSLDDERAFRAALPLREGGTVIDVQVPPANYAEGMTIGVTPGPLGSGSHRLTVDAVVPDGDTLSVYVTVHEACVTTNDLVFPYAFVFVPRDPRPVRRMAVRRTGPHLYDPSAIEESVYDDRCLESPVLKR